MAPTSTTRNTNKTRLSPGLGPAPIFNGRSRINSLSAENSVKRIKNVTHAGTRTNNPAKEYFHSVFDIVACFPLQNHASPAVYQNRLRKNGVCTQGLISLRSVIYCTNKGPLDPHKGDIMADRMEAKHPVNIDKDLLAILCCPDTKQDVSLADEALIAKLNESVRRGQLKNKANKPVTEPLDGGLIRGDRKILYPIREDIPVLLIEEGIPLDGMV